MNFSEPLSIEKIQLAFEEWEKPSLGDIKSALLELGEDYKNSAIELKMLSQGYSFQIKSAYSARIHRLSSEKPPKYSRALLETLAIIAYQQPITRAEIEEIRGVAVSSSIMKTLLERDWVKVGGQRDLPGKPTLYVTTKAFLDYFNLKSLSELPNLEFETL